MGGERGCGRNNKEHCVPAICTHNTVYMCKEEEVGSGGDSSSDNWRSLVVNETSHVTSVMTVVTGLPLCYQSILHLLLTTLTAQKLIH